MSNKQRWLAVAVFAIAMAWAEAAVVLYLRTMIDRIVPYQPNPLPASPSTIGLAPAEVVREAATMIMLFSVGWLAGSTRRSRWAYGLIAFGIWDLGYYLFLRVLTGWPATLLDWDVLFLIPLPWWGPVLAPASVAVLMIAGGTLISQYDTAEWPLWPSQRACLLSLGGVLVALYVFMADSLAALGDGVAGLRNVLPVSFNWPLFVVALVLLALPVLESARLALARHMARLPYGEHV